MSKPYNMPSMPTREHQSVSVSVEKIANGYLKTICHSGDGGYRETKEFCAKKPTVEIEARETKPAPRSRSTEPKTRMGRAVAELKRGR